MTHFDNHILMKLLEKQENGTITSEELQWLYVWYDHFPVQEDLTFVSEEERSETGEAIKRRIYAHIENKHPETDTQTRRRKRILPLLSWKAAAVLLFMIICGTMTYYFNTVDQGTVDSYTTITVPRGKNSRQVTLPDNTTVWLSPGSILRYPVRFSKKERLVKLIEGMAFFSVTKDKSGPFTVVTNGNIHTKVLGTSFNIKAYRELSGVTVSVATGVVQVSDENGKPALLRAGEQVVYSKETQRFLKSDINPREIGRWKEGAIVLNNATIDEIAVMLTKIYDVEVNYDKEKLKDCHFNIHVSNQLSLVQVLDIIQQIGGIRYTIKGRQVSLSSKQGC